MSTFAEDPRPQHTQNIQEYQQVSIKTGENLNYILRHYFQIYFFNIELFK